MVSGAAHDAKITTQSSPVWKVFMFKGDFHQPDHSWGSYFPSCSPGIGLFHQGACISNLPAGPFLSSESWQISSCHPHLLEDQSPLAYLFLHYIIYIYPYFHGCPFLLFWILKRVTKGHPSNMTTVYIFLHLVYDGLSFFPCVWFHFIPEFLRVEFLDLARVLRKDILDLHERFECGGGWGLERTFDQWVLKQPWRKCMPQEFFEFLNRL